MQNVSPFRWASRTVWRSLCSAAAGAAAAALLTVGPFAWWRLLIAAAVIITVYAVELRGRGRGRRMFLASVGVVAVAAAALRVPALAPLLGFSPWVPVLVFGLLCFFSVGDARALFGAGRVVGQAAGAAVTFSAAFLYFTLLTPLASSSSALLVPLTLGLFLALALPAGETFAASGGFLPRPALLGGGVVGLLGTETAILLSLFSLVPLGLAALLTLLLFFLLRALVAAGRGEFNPRLALRGAVLFLALAAVVFASAGRMP